MTTTRSTSICFTLLLLALLAMPAAEAGQKGNGKRKEKNMNIDPTIDFILDHGPELKLTPEQIKKLDFLQESEIKVMSEQGTTGLLDKIKDARFKKDAALEKELTGRFHDKVREKTGGAFNSFQDALNAVLTKDQFKKFDDLKNDNPTVFDKFERKEDRRDKKKGHLMNDPKPGAPEDPKAPAKDDKQPETPMPGKSINPFDL